MDLTKAICENCGGSLKNNPFSYIKDKEITCTYCGATYIVNAKHSKVGAEWEVELERLKISERRENNKAELVYRNKSEERKSNNRILLALSSFVVVSLVIISVLGFFETLNKVKITANETDLQGQNYKVVTKKLKDMGFKKVTTEKVADLKLGIFSGDGDVKEVTIDGGSDFKKDDMFDEQSVVKVYYHVFKD